MASSSSSFLSFTFENTYTLPSATTGELWPSPTGCFQSIVGVSFQGATVSWELPSRRGPSHCGQSAARTVAAKVKATKHTLAVFMAFPTGDPFSARAARALNGSLIRGSRWCRRRVFGMIQKMVQGRVVPRNAVCLGEVFQPADVFFANLLGGCLIIGITKVNAAGGWTWFAGGAQLILLKRAKFGRHRLIVSGRVLQQYGGFEAAQEQGV